MMSTETDQKIRADWSNLTEKQQKMVREFMKTGNKLNAYIAAYYPNGVDPMKTKPRSINSNCYAEYKKPHIKVIISQIQENAVKKAEIKIDDIVDEKVDDLVEAQKDVDLMKIDVLWVLKRAALIADFNINKFIRIEGKEAVYDFSVATDDDWYCISEYVADSSYVKGDCGLIPVEKLRLKSFDKLRALELVGKHINVQAFKDKVELSGDADKPLSFIVRGDDANL